jgi:hypothetical protein
MEEATRKGKEKKRNEKKKSLILIHIKNPTRCNCVSKFYFIFI